MTLFNGLAKINELPDGKRRQFEKYFSRYLQYRIRPVLADFSLLLSIIGVLILILILGKSQQGFSGIHPLVFVYTLIMMGLAVIHKLTKLRFLSPVVIYLTFSIMALFGYLDYLVKGGELKPLFGLFFFISSVGLISLSFKHSIIIVVLNLVILFAVTSIIPGNINTVDHFFHAISNWLVIMFMLMAPALALFNQWLFRNIFALQFILSDTNKQLKKTFHSLKVTENQLIQQQKYQALNHMAAGLLHEIINPANCSIQAINYAKSVNQDDELDEVLGDAAEHQARIVKIVEELKSFSQSKPDSKKRKANVIDLINSALKLCRSELKSTEVLPDVPKDLMLDCYPTAVVQVMVNLLNNGVRAIEQKERVVHPQINIDAMISRDVVTIVFRDNGIGIAEKELRKITEPFYSSSETPEQLGLGLSICQTIMRHHDGTLDIESETGEWTQVAISFPN